MDVQKPEKSKKMSPSPRWQEAKGISLINAAYTSTNPLYIFAVRNQFACSVQCCGQNVLNHRFMLTGCTGIQLAYREISKPTAATNTHYKRRLTLSALSPGTQRV